MKRNNTATPGRAQRTNKVSVLRDGKRFTPARVDLIDQNQHRPENMEHRHSSAPRIRCEKERMVPAEDKRPL